MYLSRKFWEQYTGMLIRVKPHVCFGHLKLIFGRKNINQTLVSFDKDSSSNLTSNIKDKVLFRIVCGVSRG